MGDEGSLCGGAGIRIRSVLAVGLVCVGVVCADIQETGSEETVIVGGDLYRVKWLVCETFDNADALNRWFVEGDSVVGVKDQALCVGKNIAEQKNLFTGWLKKALPKDVLIRLVGRTAGPAANNACNLNLFVHAREAGGEALEFGRSGQYNEYHAIDNYIFTFTGGVRDGWSRVRRDPGFGLLSHSNVRSEQNTSYEIVVAIRAGRLRYYIDGRRIHDVRDPEPLAGGWFGLRTWNSYVCWDDVQIGTFEKGTTVVVDSEAELNSAIGKARPGDEIVIAAGRYADWHVKADCTGSKGRPIVIRAEKAGGVIFGGKTSFDITGEHIVVMGLVFDLCVLDSSIMNLDGADHCRISRCRFTKLAGRSTVVRLAGEANYNRLDNCRFVDVAQRSVQINIKSNTPPHDNRIDHNLFADVPPLGGNGRETIQIGQDQPHWGLAESRTLIDHNIFRRCDGEGEIISNKSSYNTYRNNLFVDCRGELVMRGGSHCVIEGNRFVRCNGGIRLQGTHHSVTDNVIVAPRRTGINMAYGMDRKLGSLIQAAGNCKVANNTIVDCGEAGIYLGNYRNRDHGKNRTAPWDYAKHGDKKVQAVAPFDNEFRGNIISGTKGVLVKVDHAPENIIADNVLHAHAEATVGAKGRGAILVDPLFVNAEAGDYRLKTESPAAGVAGARGGVLSRIEGVGPAE